MVGRCCCDDGCGWVEGRELRWWGLDLVYYPLKGVNNCPTDDKMIVNSIKILSVTVEMSFRHFEASWPPPAPPMRPLFAFDPLRYTSFDPSDPNNMTKVRRQKRQCAFILVRRMLRRPSAIRPSQPLVHFGQKERQTIESYDILISTVIRLFSS